MTTATQPRYLFKILTGIHQQNRFDEEGNKVQDDFGNDILDVYVAKKTEASYQGEHLGDEIPTNTDLRKLNHPDPTARQKFALLEDYSPETTHSIEDVPSMNVEQLKQFASDHGINLE
jgi:hypothetical protein